MKIIRSDKELVGKTIAFAHIATFAENITLATEDGCVLVVTQEFDDDCDECQTMILNEYMALRYIEKSDYVRTKLGRLGLFDVEKYKQKKQEERIKREQELKAKQLKEERELYEKLKAKFENTEKASQ